MSKKIDMVEKGIQEVKEGKVSKLNNIKECIVEVFSRVTGFFRPVQDWNPGKGVTGEFGDRKTYKVKEGEDGKGTSNGAEGNRKEG